MTKSLGANHDEDTSEESKNRIKCRNLFPPKVRMFRSKEYSQQDTQASTNEEYIFQCPYHLHPSQYLLSCQRGYVKEMKKGVGKYSQYQ